LFDLRRYPFENGDYPPSQSPSSFNLKKVQKTIASAASGNWQRWRRSGRPTCGGWSVLILVDNSLIQHRLALMSAASQQRPGQRAAEAISRLWWLMLLRGVLLALLGLYAVLQPAVTLAALTQLLGAFALVDGVLAAIAGAMGWTDSRWKTWFRAAVGIVIGLFVLSHPVLVGAIAVTTIVILLAIQCIAAGIAEVVVAIRERREIEGEGWLILSGGLSIILGLLLLASPFMAGLTLVRVVGAFAIVAGIALIVIAFRIRKLGKSLEQFGEAK
jgi:uncharacterized membrane protein HdeD (DUF308 family)